MDLQDEPCTHIHPSIPHETGCILNIETGKKLNLRIQITQQSSPDCGICDSDYTYFYLNFIGYFLLFITSNQTCHGVAKLVGVSD